VSPVKDIETLNCAWRSCPAIFYEPSKWRPPPWFEIPVDEQHYYDDVIDFAGDEILCAEHEGALDRFRQQVAEENMGVVPSLIEWYREQSETKLIILNGIVAVPVFYATYYFAVPNFPDGPVGYLLVIPLIVVMLVSGIFTAVAAMYATIFVIYGIPLGTLNLVRFLVTIPHLILSFNEASERKSGTLIGPDENVLRRIWRTRFSSDKVIYSQCWYCARRWDPSVGGLATCMEFQDEIPEAILLNQHDHRNAYPGDDGFVFMLDENQYKETHEDMFTPIS